MKRHPTPQAYSLLTPAEASARRNCIAVQTVAGLPTSSWWAGQLTWQQFSALAEQQRARMRSSSLGQPAKPYSARDSERMDRI